MRSRAARYHGRTPTLMARLCGHLLLAQGAAGACAPPCGGCPGWPATPCPNDCKPPELKAERMPLAAAHPPEGMGCYTDHSPILNADDKNKGPPLMECGVWGCAGSHGCGGASSRRADCHPAGTPPSLPMKHLQLKREVGAPD